MGSTELYNPGTNTFAAAVSTPMMSAVRFGATATLLPNGQVLIAGGTLIGDYDMSNTDLYTP